MLIKPFQNVSIKNTPFSGYIVGKFTDLENDSTYYVIKLLMPEVLKGSYFQISKMVVREDHICIENP